MAASFTLNAVLAPNIHPDLAKLQCEQGANFSYRQAQENLIGTDYHRPINNHTQISRLPYRRRNAFKAKFNDTPTRRMCRGPSVEIIVQIDGGTYSD